MEKTCVSMGICSEAPMAMRRIFSTIVSVLVLAALACAGVLGQEPERKGLWDFEDGPAGWHVLKDGILSAESARTDKAPVGEGRSLRIEAAFPEESRAQGCLSGATLATGTGLRAFRRASTSRPKRPRRCRSSST